MHGMACAFLDVLLERKSIFCNLHHFETIAILLAPATQHALGYEFPKGGLDLFLMAPATFQARGWDFPWVVWNTATHCTATLRVNAGICCLHALPSIALMRPLDLSISLMKHKSGRHNWTYRQM